MDTWWRFNLIPVLSRHRGNPGPDPYIANVALLLHLDGTTGSTSFIDSSVNHLQFTSGGNASMSETQSKWGPSSLLVNGSGQYITTPNTSVLDIPSGTSATIEAWVYVTGNDSTNRARGVVSKRQPGGDVGWSCALTPNGPPRIFFYSSTGTNITGSIVMSLNSWHFIVWVMNGSQLRMYVDGALDTVVNGSSFGSNPYQLFIGSDRADVEFMNGYIDEVRITNGVARYTGNTCPVPTGPFPSPTNVDQLLSSIAIFTPTYTTWFQPQPSTLIDYIETFSSDTGQFTKYSENTPGVTSIAGNAMTITHTGSENDLIKQNTMTLIMPQVFVSVNPTIINSSASGYDISGVGLVKDVNNFILAAIDHLAGTMFIQAKINGTSNFLNTVSIPYISGSYRVALSIVGTSAVAWLDTGNGWSAITMSDLSPYFDPRIIGNLVGWTAGFNLANGGGNSTWSYQDLTIGRFGGVGIRDLTVVTNEDGSPYVNGTQVQLSATIPDPTGSGSTGVITLDLSTGNTTLNSVIMVSRSGKIYGDVSAHIIRYPNGNRRMIIGTWGNGFGGSIQTIYGLFTSGDILTGSNVVSGMTQLNLPQTGSNPGAYDAMMVYDSANSRWLIGYAITTNTTFAGSPFYAALAYSTDLINWIAIGSDPTHTGYEGAKLVYNSGQYHVIVGGPAGASTSSRIYNQNMIFEGSLAFTFSGGSTTQPHPMLFPVANKQYLVTFDNTQYNSDSFTWGRLEVALAQRYG
jgi:hypothetical protein